MGMRKLHLVGLVLLLLLLSIALLGACQPSTTPTSTPITWKLAGLVPVDHWLGKAKLWFADEVSKRTNGRLKIEYYPAGVLAKGGADALALTHQGTIAMSDVSAGHISGEVPGIDIYGLPGLIPPDNDLRRKVDRGMFPEFKKVLESKYNVYLLAIIQADPRNLYTKKKVERLADLKGLKIRGEGPGEIGFYNALGAVATFIVQTELYTALQQGVVDGSGYLDTATLSFKLYEVMKYIVPIGYDGPTQFTVVNKGAFDALPQDMQKVISDLAPALQEKTHDIHNPDMDIARKELLKLGMQVVEWPKADLDEAVRRSVPVWQEWLKNAGPLGKDLLDKVQALVK